MIEVFIAGQKASGDFTDLIGLTINNVNYQDISQRTITYTNQLTLKGTIENDKIFFRLTQLNQIELTIEELNPPFYITENGTVILEGYVIPVEMTAEVSYKITLVSKEVDFLQGISDVELQTVVTDKAKTLQTDIYGQSWDAGTTQLPQLALCLYRSVEMVIYPFDISLASYVPLADIGIAAITLDNGYLGVQAGRNMAGLDMRFAMPIKHLFELACESLGYTLEIDAAINENVSKFLQYGHILEPSQLTYSDAWKSSLSIGVKGTATNTKIVPSTGSPTTDNLWNRNMVAYTNAVIPNYSTSGIRDTIITVGTAIRVPKVGFKNMFIPKVWFKIDYTLLAGTYDDELTGLTVQIIQSISGAETGVSSLDLSVDLRNQNLYFELDEFESSPNIEATYYLRVYIEGRFRQTGAIGTNSLSIELKPITASILDNPNAVAGTLGFILENVSTNVNESYPIEVGQCIPKIKAVDLLKYICNYGFVFPKIQGKTITLTSLQTSSISGTTLNWSGLVDYTDGVKVDFRNDNYSRNNFWSYKSDDLLVGEKGNIPMLSRTTTKDATIYEAPFAISNTAFPLYGFTYAQPKILTLKAPNQYFIWNQTNRGTRYVKGDIVYDGSNYYECTVDALKQSSPTTNPGFFKLVQWHEAFQAGVSTPIILYWDGRKTGLDYYQVTQVVTDTAASYGDPNTDVDVYGVSWANLNGRVISPFANLYAQLQYEPTFTQAIATAWANIPKAMQVSRKVYVSVYLESWQVSELLDNLNSLIYIQELSMNFYLMQLNQYYLGAQQLTQVILLPA